MEFPERINREVRATEIEFVSIFSRPRVFRTRVAPKGASFCFRCLLLISSGETIQFHFKILSLLRFEGIRCELIVHCLFFTSRKFTETTSSAFVKTRDSVRNAV